MRRAPFSTSGRGASRASLSSRRRRMAHLRRAVIGCVVGVSSGSRPATSRSSQLWRPTCQHLANTQDSHIRRSFRGRPVAQGHGLRAGTRASAADAEQLRRRCCSTTCCGSITPSAIISTSSPRCAIAASTWSRCTICSPRPSPSPKPRSGSSTTRWCRTRSASAWSMRSAAISTACPTASSPRR